MILSGLTIFLTVVLVIISVLMIMVILVQRGRGGGLAGAFGAGGGGNTAFGTKTGDVFTTVTVVFFAIFMLLAVYLNHAFRQTPVLKTEAAPAAQTPAGSPKTDAGQTGSTTLPKIEVETKPATILPTVPATTTATATVPATLPATVPATIPGK